MNGGVPARRPTGVLPPPLPVCISTRLPVHWHRLGPVWRAPNVGSSARASRALGHPVRLSEFVPSASVCAARPRPPPADATLHRRPQRTRHRRPPTPPRLVPWNPLLYRNGGPRIWCVLSQDSPLSQGAPSPGPSPRPTRLRPSDADDHVQTQRLHGVTQAQGCCSGWVVARVLAECPNR